MNFRKLAVILAVLSLTAGFSLKSFAAGTAVVDLGKIRENYTVAQALEAEANVKENELKQFAQDAQKQIQDAKTPLEKKNLEEKLGQQFEIKRMAYAKDQAVKWSKVENDVVKTIKEVSTANKYDLVLNKQVVIDGGCDITELVIDKLNKSVVKPDAKK